MFPGHDGHPQKHLLRQLSLETVSSGNWSEISTAVGSHGGTGDDGSWHPLDVEHLLDYLVAVRFPRLNIDGDWETPEPETVLGNIQHKIDSVVDAPRKAFKGAFKMTGLGTEEIKLRPHMLVSALRTYAPDAAGVAAYTIGSLIFGHYYSVWCGLFTTLAMILGNAGKVADWLFEFFDFIEEEFQDAIDRLQHQLESQVVSLLQPPVGIPIAIAMHVAIDAAQYTFHLRDLLPVALQARRNFMWRAILPFAVLALAQFSVQLYIAHRALENGAYATPSGGPEAAAAVTTTTAVAAAAAWVAPAAAASANGIVPLTALGAGWAAQSQAPGGAAGGFVQAWEAFPDSAPAGTASRGPVVDIQRLASGGGWDATFYRQLAAEFVSFVSMALLKSWPVIRLVVNNAVAFAEYLTNRILRHALSPEAIYHAVGGVASGGAVLVRRSCTRVCGPPDGGGP